MIGLVLEEFVLLLALLRIYIAMGGTSLVNGLNFAFQFNNFARLHLLLGF